jgi:hypothetical protein
MVLSTNDVVAAAAAALAESECQMPVRDVNTRKLRPAHGQGKNTTILSLYFRTFDLYGSSGLGSKIPTLGCKLWIGEKAIAGCSRTDIHASRSCSPTKLRRFFIRLSIHQRDLRGSRECRSIAYCCREYIDVYIFQRCELNAIAGYTGFAEFFAIGLG